jgi:site-specific recombinase XerD
MMVVSAKLEAPPGTALKSLVRGYLLTHQTEGSSPDTVEYYRGILSRFLWYAGEEGWAEDARLLNEWHIREFLGYVATEANRWRKQGNGSESSSRKASSRTVHHYYSALRAFFNWAVREGFLAESPLARVKVAKSKPKIIQPYSLEHMKRMLQVCDQDYQHNAKFLGSRNKAVILVFLDSGLRLSELASLKLRDIDTERGWIKVTGKGGKERVVRIGKVAQKALWRYLIHRGETDRQECWLSEERRPLQAWGIQSSVDRLKKRAGINEEGCVHRFRHTFALNFLRADRNPFNLQYLLGHNSLEMVRRYTATLGMEDALEAHVKASPADLLGLK